MNRIKQYWKKSNEHSTQLKLNSQAEKSCVSYFADWIHITVGWILVLVHRVCWLCLHVSQCRNTKWIIGRWRNPKQFERLWKINNEIEWTTNAYCIFRQTETTRYIVTFEHIFHAITIILVCVYVCVMNCCERKCAGCKSTIHIQKKRRPKSSHLSSS